MQEFYPLNEQDYVNVALPKMQKSIESASSCFSGDVFPTENLAVGMLCFRTDANALYQLTALNPATWKEVGSSKDSAGNEIDTTYGKLAGNNTWSGSNTFSVGVTTKSIQTGATNALTLAVNGATGTITKSGSDLVFSGCAVKDGSGRVITDTYAVNKVFTGATATTAGVSGLVPAPTKGNQAKVLRADGTWVDLPAVPAIKVEGNTISFGNVKIGVD